MHGNVWQWCADLYNPKDAASARVYRGSSWGDDGWLCQAAVRREFPPWSRDDRLGFRLARVPSAPGK